MVTVEVTSRDIDNIRRYRYPKTIQLDLENIHLYQFSIEMKSCVRITPYVRVCSHNGLWGVLEHVLHLLSSFALLDIQLHLILSVCSVILSLLKFFLVKGLNRLTILNNFILFHLNFVVLGQLDDLFLGLQEKNEKG